MNPATRCHVTASSGPSIDHGPRTTDIRPSGHLSSSNGPANSILNPLNRATTRSRIVPWSLCPRTDGTGIALSTSTSSHLTTPSNSAWKYSCACLNIACRAEIMAPPPPLLLTQPPYPGIRPIQLFQSQCQPGIVIVVKPQDRIDRIPDLFPPSQGQRPDVLTARKQAAHDHSRFR